MILYSHFTFGWFFYVVYRRCNSKRFTANGWLNPSILFLYHNPHYVNENFTHMIKSIYCEFFNKTLLRKSHVLLALVCLLNCVHRINSYTSYIKFEISVALYIYVIRLLSTVPTEILSASVSV